MHFIVLMKLAAETVSFEFAGRAVLARAAPTLETMLLLPRSAW